MRGAAFERPEMPPYHLERQPLERQPLWRRWLSLIVDWVVGR